MCKKMTANYVEVLGTRRIGWQLWDGQLTMVKSPS